MNCIGTKKKKIGERVMKEGVVLALSLSYVKCGGGLGIGGEHTHECSTDNARVQKLKFPCNALRDALVNQ